MNLRDIDLNLLVVFQQLYKERRVAAVAETLGLTQPAVSNALARLRKMLGDELFLRTGRGMEPTPYASYLAEPIANALASIRDTLERQLEFDPVASERTFTLAMTDLGEVHFLPRLMGRLAEVGPGVTISTVRNTSVNLGDELESGRVDIAIGLLPQLKAGFFQRLLFRQRYVCIFRKGHRLDRGSMSLDDFEGAQHVVVVAGGTGHAMVDETIARRGIRRNVRLSVPHFIALGNILSSTDLIATVPERYLRESMAPFNLTYLPLPVPVPEFDVNLFWHARFHKEPGNQWLRNVIAELAI
ncbi:LysR family transcriptional regulator [Massilia sp. GCM10023247]|uniref:LysR family transcriptional regulator n=1 Tax=Massilia sp. GCM10023247 TaxID=3252643 RepID=UPI0036172FE0